jgi:hypothetical protein
VYSNGSIKYFTLIKLNEQFLQIKQTSKKRTVVKILFSELSRSEKFFFFFLVFLLLEESTVVLRGKGSEKVSSVCTNFTSAVLVVVLESVSLIV